MRLRFIASLSFVVVSFFSASAFAHDYTVGYLTIKHPWARATVAGQSVGGGFMTLHNTGKQDDALIAVQWAGSSAVELHTHTMKDGVMQMRQVPKIALPAGQALHLAPGGLHLMFMNLTKPLALGEKRDAVLVFEKAGKIKVQFMVEPLDYKPSGASETMQQHAKH